MIRLAGAALGAAFGLSLAAGAARASGILTQFQGGTLSQSGFVPPDMGGSVGGGYVLQLLNGVASTYTTAGSTVSQVSLNSFWGIPTQISDPRIIFDSASQRWFASAITVTAATAGNVLAANQILVAVSKSANPTAGFTTLSFASANATSFADFPTLGVNGAAVTIGTNDFATSTGSFIAPSVYSIPKSSLIGATPTLANMSSFTQTNQVGIAPQAVTNPSGTGTATSVVSVGNISGVYALSTVSGAAGAGATLALTQTYSQPLLSNTLVAPTQPGGTTYDPGDSRISSGAYQAGNNIYFANTVATGNGTGIDQISWNVLNATSTGAVASGLLTIAGINLTYPSISANVNGTFVISFNGSGSGTTITDYYVVCSAVTATCGAPQTAFASAASNYNNAPAGTNRWGDYSWTTVDPANPNNFWLFQQYAPTNASWATVITQISTTAGSAVPEPAGIFLFATALIFLGLARSRPSRS